jgi:N-acetylglucosaminyldiphosphoundecaprenol N-acetyl-beta-D-mannosaminyltransferase
MEPGVDDVCDGDLLGRGGMKIESTTILGVPVAAATMEQTLEVIEYAIDTHKQIYHVVVNAAKLVNMRRNPALCRSVLEADLINADGQAVVWASCLFGKRLPERVTGIDLMHHLAQRASERGYRIYFLGARKEVVREVVRRYGKKYGAGVIAGYHDGYFGSGDEDSVVREIAASGANILFVAMNSPKKEIFLSTHRKTLRNVSFIMGVGGSFDVIAGVIRRAPVILQQLGLEWFFRFLQEPRRMWKRYLVTNVFFVYYLITDWLKRAFARRVWSAPLS